MEAAVRLRAIVPQFALENIVSCFSSGGKTMEQPQHKASVTTFGMPSEPEANARMLDSTYWRIIPSAS